MTTIFEELDPWIRQEIFERFVMTEYWHVLVLRNHTRSPDFQFWSKCYDQFMNLWQAQEFAREKYPDVPIRFVRVIWEPHIEEIRT